MCGLYVYEIMIIHALEGKCVCDWGSCCTQEFIYRNFLRNQPSTVSRLSSRAGGRMNRLNEPHGWGKRRGSRPYRLSTKGQQTHQICHEPAWCVLAAYHRFILPVVDRGGTGSG